MRRNFNVINFAVCNPCVVFVLFFVERTWFFCQWHISSVKGSGGFSETWGFFPNGGCEQEGIGVKWPVWSSVSSIAWPRIREQTLSSFHSKMFYRKANDLGYYPFFGKHLYPLQVVVINLGPSRSIFIFTSIFTIIQCYDAWFRTECFMIQFLIIIKHSGMDYSLLLFPFNKPYRMFHI